MISKPSHRKIAKEYIVEAEAFLRDNAYTKLHGYNEINVLLTLADLHERLSR